MKTHTRRDIQELKIRVSQAKDSSRTPEENWMDVDRWTANTDEDHAEGVQGLLLLILERHGTALLNLAAQTEARWARFQIALVLQERHLPRVKTSRILAAIRRWARGEENVRGERALAISLGEVALPARSAVAFRGAR